MERGGIRVFCGLIVADSAMLHSGLRWLGCASIPPISGGIHGLIFASVSASAALARTASLDGTQRNPGNRATIIPYTARLFTAYWLKLRKRGAKRRDRNDQ